MANSNNLKTENYVKDVLFIFFAQKYLILGTTIIIFAAAIAIAILWPRTYGAYGSVLLRGKAFMKSPQALEKIDVRSFPITREDLFSEMELLRSPDVIKRALKSLQEKGDPAGDMPSYKVRSKLQANILPASFVIQLGIEGKKPDELVSIIDEIMRQYVLYRTEVHFPSGALDFYTKQAALFKSQLDDIERELIALVETTDTPDPIAEIGKNLNLKQNLEQELYMHRNKAIQMAADVEHLETLLNAEQKTHFNFISNSTLNQISTRLVDLKIERGKVARNYQPDSKAVQRIDEQIVKTQNLLRFEVSLFKDDMASKLEAVRGKIIALESNIERIDADNVALKRQSLRQDELLEEASLLRESHQTFVRRREEARMNSQVDSATYSSFFVSILASAYSSGSALFPKPNILIPVGLIAGLLTGFALGFLREYFDHTFKHPRDVEAFAGMPLLFSLPIMPKPLPPENPSEGGGKRSGREASEKPEV